MRDAQLNEAYWTIFERHGYHSRRDLAVALQEKGFYADAKLNHLEGRLSKILGGTKPLTRTLLKGLKAIVDNDPELLSLAEVARRKDYQPEGALERAMLLTFQGHIRTITGSYPSMDRRTQFETITELEEIVKRRCPLPEKYTGPVQLGLFDEPQ